jgi:hypothetical protein
MSQFRKARALFTFPKKLSDELNGHFKVRKGTRPLQEAHTEHSRWQVFWWLTGFHFSESASFVQ